MEQHEDDDDSLTNGLHRTFKQDVEVLESVVNAIMDAEGDADPAIFKKAQVIVSVTLALNSSIRAIRSFCTKIALQFLYFCLRRVCLFFSFFPQLDFGESTG